MQTFQTRKIPLHACSDNLKEAIISRFLRNENFIHSFKPLGQQVPQFVHPNYNQSNPPARLYSRRQTCSTYIRLRSQSCAFPRTMKDTRGMNPCLRKHWQHERMKSSQFTSEVSFKAHLEALVMTENKYLDRHQRISFQITKSSFFFFLNEDFFRAFMAVV